MTGRQFRAARVALGLNQKDLSILIGKGWPKGQAYVSDLETGRRPISGKIEKIVKGLLHDKFNSGAG